MASRLIQVLIHLIFFWHNIDAAVLDCIVYPVILQLVPDNIVGIIAIANSSSEEIFITHVAFDKSAQFPLSFTVVITNEQFPPGRYITQLQIFKTPRVDYDLPLWTAESIDKLEQSSEPNIIILRAYNDNPFIGPCIMGIVLNTHPSFPDLSNNVLNVKVASMPIVSMNIHNYTEMFPILFMITNIPPSEIKNSTSVGILITNPNNILAYQAREQTVITSNSQCSTMLFHVTQELWLNITITLGANVFTSIPLTGFGVVIRIYDKDYLIFEQSYVMDVVEFPFIIPKQRIPISQTKNYSVEATIFGPVPGYTIGISLFQGVKRQKLNPGFDNTVQISMLYIGPKIGTTIIGTIYQKYPNQNTWPLAGLNLAIVINNQAINDSQAIQFTIFDQTFPLQFVLLNLQKITADYQNIIFTITITFLDATVIWDTIIAYNKILLGVLNQLDFYVTKADGYRCLTGGQGNCNSASREVNKISIAFD